MGAWGRALETVAAAVTGWGWLVAAARGQARMGKVAEVATVPGGRTAGVERAAGATAAASAAAEGTAEMGGAAVAMGPGRRVRAAAGVRDRAKVDMVGAREAMVAGTEGWAVTGAWVATWVAWKAERGEV